MSERKRHLIVKRRHLH
ncbi:hypothetical protein PENNAL_c0300G00898 [Penicillium nalgiovense]|uniref:Uncharacterized protein n=1 Tax=Penicillium nalgiovense TaxID=60175 RepID=A0A1V6WCV6_PENNA|nr:hypothetical protein PENNAL_c0300G00898 [Penicillium nalgiovense]